MCHLVRTNIYDFNVWVLPRCEDSADLGVLSLEKFLHAHAFDLVDRERVDVYLHSFSLFDLTPLLFELFHHLSPYEHVVVVLGLYLSLSLFLKLVQAVCLLNHSSFLD